MHISEKMGLFFSSSLEPSAAAASSTWKFASSADIAPCWMCFDVYAMLAVGGVFVIADMIEPATAEGRDIAADALDEVVRQRSLELDGSTAGLDFFLQEGWNTYRYFDPDDIDHPSSLFDQLKWLERAGFMDVDVHFMQAGHVLFSGWKKGEKAL